MKIDDYIYVVKNKGYSQSGFEKYVNECSGIDKLKKKDLDKMVAICQR